MSGVRAGLCMAWCLVAAVALASVAGCAGGRDTLEASTRAMLDGFTEMGDPASKLATVECLRSQDMALTLAEKGVAGQLEAYRAITLRCTDLVNGFASLREAQDRAATLLEQGDVVEAAREVSALRVRFRELTQ